MRISIHRWAGHWIAAAAAILVHSHSVLGEDAASDHAPPRPEVTLHEENLGKSLVIVAIPPKAHGGVALFAHGFRPPEAPLSAALDVKSGFNRQLLDAGWILAATSYRRNGWITKEAVEDLRELRKFVASRHREPKRVLLIGSSLGGYIGMLAAEQPQGLVDGVLALGAGGIPEDEQELSRTFSMAPRIPLLFLSNAVEADGPKRYAKKAPPGSVAVWTVKRGGHVNISEPEQASAWAALLSWLDGHPPALERDASIDAPPPKSRAEFIGDTARAKITALSAAHGNFVSEFTAEDLGQLGLKIRQRLLVEANGKSFEALWGTKYSDVPEGEGVVFLTGDGLLRIARNFANAAATLEVKEGDSITIRPIPAKR